MSRATAVLALVTLFTGCGGDTTAGTTDSIVTLTATPVLDLALGTDDSVVIGRLSHATRLTDGRVVVLDGDAMSLVFLDSTGGELKRAGRAGAGPGEFENPAWVAPCDGDSLFVWDASLGRIAVFDPDGRFVRQFTPPVAQPFRIGCNRNGTLAAFDASAFPNGPPTPGDIPMLRGHLVLFDTRGDSIGTIADQPLGQNRVLGPLAVLAVGAEEVLIGISDSPSLWRHGLSGQRIGTTLFPLPVRPLSDSSYGLELDRMSGSTGSTGPTRLRIREILAQSPKPTNYPLYFALLFGDDDTAWLITSALIDPTTTLLGRTADGQLFSLTLPARFEVFEIGSDYVLGKGSGEEGGERLVMYRIEGPVN